MPDFAAMPAALAPSATEASNAPTSVSLFDQGLIQGWKLLSPDCSRWPSSGLIQTEQVSFKPSVR